MTGKGTNQPHYNRESCLVHYGGRTVKITSAGDAPFIGTANPFYGCQVWKITDEDYPEPSGGGGSAGGLAPLALLFCIPLLLIKRR